MEGADAMSYATLLSLVSFSSYFCSVGIRSSYPSLLIPVPTVPEMMIDRQGEQETKGTERDRARLTLIIIREPSERSERGEGMREPAK